MDDHPMWHGGDYAAAWYDRQGNRLNMDEAAATLADQEGRSGVPRHPWSSPPPARSHPSPTW